MKKVKKKGYPKKMRVIYNTGSMQNFTVKTKSQHKKLADDLEKTRAEGRNITIQEL